MQFKFEADFKLKYYAAKKDHTQVWNDTFI